MKNDWFPSTQEDAPALVRGKLSVAGPEDLISAAFDRDFERIRRRLDEIGVAHVREQLLPYAEP